ncbi:polymorphic toxin type 44 domain-containing protein [Achromobacter mucicolens]|uniref:PAAR domain-containing protein n=1 Tax=Achromobacter mucicolens TaxID=1389922 RepID=UPI00244B4CA9|nr:polymorphic toxin type 44 domain-containing protein [Achromobacter mucicolens]MDH0091216.1 polymorphic toxin type 44 domain-containing protein [Achromobacter mucicolens]
MAARPIIRVGDSTSHGGTVVEGFPFYNLFGQPAAGLGHMVFCPQCKGTFPIVEGVSSFSIDEGFVAIEGMKTSCGATLIASQRFAVVDPGPGRVVRASSEGSALASVSFGGAGRAAPIQPLHSSLSQADCDHADTAVPVAEYIVQEMKTNPFSIEGKKILSANSADPKARRAQWQELPWYLRLGQPPDFELGAAGQKMAAYGMWAERVGPGRPWDHKPYLIETLSKKNALNKGWQKYGDHDYFLDIWSNIHYGYVGLAVGFSATELINGAGIAQALDDLRRLKPPQDHPENGPWPARADDVPDHISIKLGADLYSDVKPHALTVEILLERIEAVPLPWGKGRDKAKEAHNCNRKQG